MRCFAKSTGHLAWQRRTNLWREATSPARGFRLLTSDRQRGAIPGASKSRDLVCRFSAAGLSPPLGGAKPRGKCMAKISFTRDKPSVKRGIAMKRCAHCHEKLGLGVRSRNLWNGRWWVHVLYCSTHCEALNELERYNARAERGWHIIPRSSPQN